MGEIIKRIKTKEEAQKLEEEIHLLLDSLYGSSEYSFESTLKFKVRAWVTALIYEEIKAGKSPEDFLKELNKKLEKLTEVKLVIAFEPTPTSLEKFADWVKGNLGEEVVLDINCDENILGGAKIIYKGRFWDLSISRLFNEELHELAQ